MFYTNYSSSPLDKVLLAFNNEPLQCVNDTYDVQADSTISMLFLGNSLTYCGVPEEEPDKTLRGLTSTSVDKDFVHQVLRYVSENKQVNIDYSITNIADFERHFSAFMSCCDDKFSHIRNLHPDYLIVQIGENVSHEDEKQQAEELRQCYMALLRRFPQSKRIITLPFWHRSNLNYLFTQIALDTQSYIADLSYLGNDKSGVNFASSYKHYAQPGVGAHPGDVGMQRIAQTVFSVINAE